MAVKEVPEFTGSVNAVESAVHEVPEYTGVMGTAGDQAAPTVDKPTEEVRVLSDKINRRCSCRTSKRLGTRHATFKVQKSKRPKSTRYGI